MSRLKVTCTILFGLFMLACTNPQRLIENGNPERAYQVGLRKCKSGNVKAKNLYVLQASYELVTIEDAEVVDELVNRDQPSVWPQVYLVGKRMEKRKKEVTKIAEKLENREIEVNIRHFPVEDLLEEAAEKSAQYFYDEAVGYADAARDGDRLAARKAHGFLERCRHYRNDFRDAPDLTNEMYELGTTYILLNPDYEDLDVRFASNLFGALFRKKTYPQRKGWQYFMTKAESDKMPNYEVNLYFSNLYDSPESVSSSRCTAEKEIQCGEKETKEWNEQDSVWVTVKEPIYETVRATVETFNQSKSASLILNMEVWDVALQAVVNREEFRGYENWSNSYSEVSGDKRALGGGCDDRGGWHSNPPSGSHMLVCAAGNVRRQFFRKLKRLD